MRVGLFPFQEQALDDLNRKIDKAHMLWSDQDPQVISFSAPTGAGKTVIITYSLHPRKCHGCFIQQKIHKPG